MPDETIEVENPVVKSEQEVVKPSIAELMAKTGVYNDTDQPKVDLTKSDNKQDNPESTQKVETKTEATSTSEQPKDEKTESPAEKVVTDKKVDNPAIQEPTKTKEPTLSEVLKKEQPGAILKAIGFDDNEVKVLHALKGFKDLSFFENFIAAMKDGKATDYLKEWTTDYSKMAAEEVMRHQLRQDYPKASEKQLELLYRDKIVKPFNLDSEDESEVEDGRLLLEAEADKHRDTFITNQKGKLTPEFKPAPDTAQEEQKQILEQQQKEIEQYKSFVNDSPITKEVLKNKSITIGTGDDKFTYPVDPTAVLSLLSDNQAWANALLKTETGADGEEISYPDLEKQILISAISLDHNGFIKELKKHFKSLGGEKVVNSIENASQVKDQNNNASQVATGGSPAQQLAKGGKINYGGGTQ